MSVVVSRPMKPPKSEPSKHSGFGGLGPSQKMLRRFFYTLFYRTQLIKDGGDMMDVMGEGGFHDRYTLGKKLGQGNFGQVRACVSRHGLQQTFVVKILDVRRIQRSSSATQPKLSVGRLSDAQNECELWYRLNGSQYCVELYEAFAENLGMYYLVMERCECSLWDKLEEMMSWTASEMCAMLEQMLLGICHTHSRGIVHRDIKPDNFLYGLDKVVKLADFGLAAALPRPVIRLRMLRCLRDVAGTVPYMSPEMLMNRYYDTKTDIWSYGVTAYVLLYGEFPYGPKAKTSENMIKCITDGVPEPSYTPGHKLEVAAGTAHRKLAQEFADHFGRRLLERCEKRRWSARDALRDNFFAMAANEDLSMWSSTRSIDYSSEASSEFEFRPLVQMARARTREFDLKRADPTIETDLDTLLLRLQQEHGGSGAEFKRSFSMPRIYAKDSPPSLQDDESDEEVDGDRSAKAAWYRRRSQSAFAVGTHSLGSNESGGSTWEELRERYKIARGLKHSGTGSTLDPWFEESWQDRCDLDGEESEPPPMPRLPPCQIAPLGNRNSEDSEKRINGIDAFCWLR